MGEYDYRHGTGENYGFEYEDQMIAYLATAACNQKEIKDFWIASNIVGLGAWDDVLLYTETQKGEKKLQFLQLKHKGNINTGWKFKDWKDDLQKYARDYEQISSLISYNVPNKDQYKIKEILEKTGVQFENFEFILMTNAVFKTHPRLSVICKDSFIKTNIEGPVYQISPNMTDINTHNDFFNQFFIFSEQSGVNDKALLNNIIIQLKLFISHTNFESHLEVAKYLLTLLKEWFLSETRTLSSKDVKEKISFCILSALKHTKPIDDNYPILNKNEFDIFQNLIKPYQCVLYSNRESTLKNFFDEQNSHYFIIYNMVDFKFVINCIKTAKTIKVIMLIPNTTSASIFGTEITTLNLLNTLPVESLARIYDYEIRIQGRKTTFGWLLNQYSDVKNIFGVDDVINLLLGKLVIGESYNFLSYYAARSIPRIFVEKTIFIEMPRSFFIVIVEDNLVESEIKIKCNLQSKSRKNEVNEKGFNFQCIKGDVVRKAISNVQRKFNSVHILKYSENAEDFQLEWLSSSENLKEVRNCINEEKYDVKPIGDNFTDLYWDFTNKLVIVANPGMGKTYFLNNLTNNYPVDWWIILVVLNEVDFNNTENLQTYLAKYHTKKLNANDRKIFELYLKKKMVVVLFDAFDEIAPEYNIEALSLMNEAIKEKLKIVVTSREITKKFLEENLQTIAFTLNPFSNDDKITFFQHFYSRNIKKPDNLGMDVIENRIKTFILNLLKNCSINQWDEEFTGVPLQCRLLAEGFIEECQVYCETDYLNNIPININLITLYENFIQSKFSIYWKEKENLFVKDMKSYERIIKYHRCVFFSNHMIAAVQTIFPRVGIKISDEFVKEIENANEKHGIIIGLDGNRNPMFIHRTFAEYFAAKWFVEIKEGKMKLDESKRGEYLRILFEPQFNVVRDLFDRLVCKHCHLHNAVLNAELSKVRDILEKNGNLDDGKCGRNALHLISARGAQHETVEKTTWEGKKYWEIICKEEEKYLDILDFLLENIVWIIDEDNVLGWTPQQYANQRNAFGVIDRLCGYNGSQIYNLQNSFMSKWKIEEILRMCVTYDYFRFADNVIQKEELNSHTLKSMTYKLSYKDEGSLFHLAAENGSVKILDVLLKYLDVNIKNSKGETPLHLGCRYGHITIVKALVENGGDLFLLDKYGSTPIDRAVYSGHRELVEYITGYDVLKIGFGEDINAALPGWYGRSPLYYAAMGKNMSSLERLISEGANLNITDKYKNTAIHWITKKEYFDESIGRRLIESGLNIDSKNSEGKTALHSVAQFGIKEGVKLFLQCGANPNIIDEEQQTALHSATESGSKECVELLLQYGSNTNIVDNKHRTALSWAREHGRNKIFLILWETTLVICERDSLHKSLLTDGHDMEVRKRTFVGFPQELSHLIDVMSNAGLYYYGVKDYVKCFSCNCWLTGWGPSDDPWAKHAIHWMGPDCQLLLKEKGMKFIESCRNRIF